MNISELKNKPLPLIPAEIREAISCPHITITPFEEKDEILKNGSLQTEAGFARFADGSYLVSVYCPMKDITPEMINWWFWWHPKADERYQVWFPGAHYSIGYNAKDKSYFSGNTCPPFRNNTQYPVEKIGGMRMPLGIDFITPEEFGFSRNVMQENNIPLIICGHVGAFRGLIPHTEMAHIFRQDSDGLYLISRFWLGKTMNPLLRRIFINDKMAKGMAEHCAVEYRNLAEILPFLYNEYSK